VLPLLLACTAPDPGDSASAAPPVTGDFVATELTVAPADEAFDLDGDGAPDDAIVDLADAIDALVAARFATNVHVLLLQLADVNDWSDDAAVRVAMFPAVDADTDGSDNDSGDEVFDATGFVDAGGIALDSDSAALSGGAYTTVLTTDTFQVGSIVFAVATGVHLAGSGDAGTQSGVAGIGVTKDAITSALTAEAVDPSVITLLTDLADLDLDGDGTPETVSMAFRYDATVCTITTE
jgi:hypothetical protein